MDSSGTSPAQNDKKGKANDRGAEITLQVGKMAGAEYPTQTLSFFPLGRNLAFWEKSTCIQKKKSVR